MSKKILLVLAVLLAVAFAGCHEKNTTDDDAGAGDGDGDGGAGAPDIGFTDIQGPTTVAAGENFTVTYTVTSTGTHTTSHIGAHWSMESTAASDVATLKGSDFDGKSPHNFDATPPQSEVSLPGTYTISGWNFTEPGTYYYRPHLQITDGDTTRDFWGAEQVIVVTA